MLPSTCIVVPTYWTRAGGQPRPGDAIYDHPTAVDGDDTLTALLGSLANLDTGAFYLLVLVAVTGDDAAEAAEARVRKIAGRFPSLVSLVFGQAELRRLHERLSASGMDAAGQYLRLRDYPAIRNLQLAIPVALGSDAIVALDDDEIVTDSSFVSKATAPLGTEIDGHRVDGLSGYYLQDDGGILLRVDPAKAESPNLFDRKAAIMNWATEALEAESGTTVETPFCFGGNMEFSADLAASVGFDPGITRGEDIDYLINARMEGRHFFLRKDLRILHCPPSGGSYQDTSCTKVEQDIVRFIYEQEKVRVSQSDSRLYPVRAEDLGIYPGDFLRQDITEDAVAALRQAGFEGDARACVRRSQSEAPERMARYLTFRERWPAIQDAVARDAGIRSALMAEVRGV